MGWQEWATWTTVLGAVAYLVWKVGLSPRGKKKAPTKRGPDVPLRRLTEKRRKG